MSAEILDGKQIAKEIRAEVAAEIQRFVESGGPQPCLTAILVGEDPASQVYVRNKGRACEQAGIEGRTHRLPADTSQQHLLDLIEQLNRDDTVHGNVGSVAATERRRI